MNPATGVLIADHAELSDVELERRLEAAHLGYRVWSETTLGERADVLRAAASDLRQRSEPFARLMAAEMGKPLPQGRAEVEKCALVCDYYAENGAGFLEPEIVSTDAAHSYVTYRPLGPVLAVMPWNFPLWQAYRFAAPALMAGNVGLLKHAANVQGCAVAMEESLRRAGVIDGGFQNLAIAAGRVAGVIRDPRVRAVTLTGSTAAGKAVASCAGAVAKKTVLELGGADPYLILEDCDVAIAVEKCATSRLINTGQSCIAAKRFVVHESIVEEFTERLVENFSSKSFGDPLTDENVDMGPLARWDLRDELHDQVLRSVAAGADLRCGGLLPAGPGAYYPATVLAGVTPDVPVYTEETFGPVAAIIAVRDDAEAVAIANDSEFGLGAAVFSRDVARAERIARDGLQAGCCFVNDFVRSDPRLPFGGIKGSGYGRELGHHGIREFVNIKTVYVGSGT